MRGEMIAAGPGRSVAASEAGAHASPVDPTSPARRTRSSAAAPARHEPETFRTSRLLDFANQRELTAQIGHPPTMWPQVTVKEMLDNALDAAEQAGPPPRIKATVTPAMIEVTDNGPGLAGDVVDGVLDFAVRVSRREAYVGPTRGAQGNALKTLLVMPFVLDGKAGLVEIESRGVRHRISLAIDPIDLALCKGVSTTAARTLIDALVGDGVPVFCIRAFDLAGFTIAGTLGRDTRRYTWSSEGAIDLGLRLADVNAYGLESEEVFYTGANRQRLADPEHIRRKIGGPLRENGASEAEIDFLLHRRVELNAFASDQLVAWIEGKLEEHGVGKVVPDQDTLEAAARGFARDLLARRYLVDLAEQIEREIAASALGDLRGALTEELTSTPEVAWDDARQKQTATKVGGIQT